MVYIKDWVEYFTIEESIKITDNYIEKSAKEMIFELKKARAEKEKVKLTNKELTYV